MAVLYILVILVVCGYFQAFELRGTSRHAPAYAFNKRYSNYKQKNAESNSLKQICLEKAKASTDDFDPYLKEKIRLCKFYALPTKFHDGSYQLQRSRQHRVLGTGNYIPKPNPQSGFGMNNMVHEKYMESADDKRKVPLTPPGWKKKRSIDVPDYFDYFVQPNQVSFGEIFPRFNRQSNNNLMSNDIMNDGITLGKGNTKLTVLSNLMKTIENGKNNQGQNGGNSQNSPKAAEQPPLSPPGW